MAPAQVLLREVLAQESLEAALALLERAPRSVPNNFILADRTRVVNVELSPA